MNIHEHQAKDVLRQFGVPLANGVAVFSLDDAKRAIDSLPGPLWVTWCARRRRSYEAA